MHKLVTKRHPQRSLPLIDTPGGCLVEILAKVGLRNVAELVLCGKSKLMGFEVLGLRPKTKSLSMLDEHAWTWSDASRQPASSKVIQAVCAEDQSQRQCSDHDLANSTDEKRPHALFA
jgi:hypothetical protein